MESNYFMYLEEKGRAFVKDISSRIDKSLDYIKTKYVNNEKLNLASNFMSFNYTDAMKSDVEQLSRVSYFICTEIEMELDHALKHAFSGSYKAAFADLRRALELSVVSVYLTLPQVERKKAVDWVGSKVDTPFFSKMKKEILKNKRFQEFNDKHKWDNRITDLYHELADYSHNKGMLKGYRALNKVSSYGQGTSIPEVNFDTLSIFCDFYIQTVEEILVNISLYNPVLLVGLPIEEKFGVNPPASGYYNEAQSEQLLKLIPDEYKEYFTQLTQSDEEVEGVVKWIQKLPDLTDDELQAQVDEFDILFNMSNDESEAE